MAPWWREMWLGWEEIPRGSKVRRMSIVEVGGSLFVLLEGVVREEVEVGVLREKEEEEVLLRVDFRVVEFDGVDLEVEEDGVKAEESIPAIPSAGHVVVILSGNSGSSIINTSAGERSPSSIADSTSSRFRVSPKPSAFPTFQQNPISPLSLLTR